MSQHSSLDDVGDFDFLAIWIVHENAGPGSLKLKRFGMTADGDLLGLFPRQIQECKRPGPPAPGRFSTDELFSAVTDKNAVAVGVIADVVRIAVELHGLLKLKTCCVKNLHRAVTPEAMNRRLVGGS